MMINLLIGITLSAMLVFITFVIAVLLVKIIKKTSLEKALDTVSNFFQLLSSTNANCSVTPYPVYIGFNGVDWKASNIERAFQHLEKYWEIIYFDCIYNNHPNVIVYQFRVYEPIYSDIRKARLLGLVQNVAEKALAIHMHNFNCYVSVVPFIAVRLQYDILQIAIAKNSVGFKNIATLRKQY